MNRRKCIFIFIQTEIIFWHKYGKALETDFTTILFNAIFVIII